jgi:hypothetical protein
MHAATHADQIQLSENQSYNDDEGASDGKIEEDFNFCFGLQSV